MLKEKKTNFILFFGLFNVWFVGENTKHENIEEK